MYVPLRLLLPDTWAASIPRLWKKKNAAVGLGVPLCFQNVESDVSTATTVVATQEGSRVQEVRGGVQL